MGVRRRGGRRGGSRKRKRKSNSQVDMERDDHVELEGLITNVYAGGIYDVETDVGTTVKAQLSGRMRRYRIRVILGDRVKVKLSPYDLTHGFITWRGK